MARTTRLSIGAVLAACAIIGAPSIALAASITDPTPTPQCLLRTSKIYVSDNSA